MGLHSVRVCECVVCLWVLKSGTVCHHLILNLVLFDEGCMYLIIHLCKNASLPAFNSSPDFKTTPSDQDHCCFSAK